MCGPLELGTCEDGVYLLQTWIQGEDGEKVIPCLPKARQYTYGLDAGRILKRLHSVPAPETQEAWEPRYSRKVEQKIQNYRECPIHYENGRVFLEYVRENRHLLRGRPQVLQHGDYHIGNMMIDQAGTLQIIDFDKCSYGDPWEEFNRITWCVQASPAFASGLVDGYFDGPVPGEFWRLLAFYICVNALGSLPWAIPFGPGEVDTMQNQAREVLSWYDQMHKTVPSWYLRP